MCWICFRRKCNILCLMSFLLKEKLYSWSFWSETSFVLYVDICHVIIWICLIIQHWSVCNPCFVLIRIWILLMTFPVEMKNLSGFEQYLFNLILRLYWSFLWILSVTVTVFTFSSLMRLTHHWSVLWSPSYSFM